MVAELSRETLRRILHAGGVSWQTTTTWKASTDPDFIPKMRRVLDLYDQPPDDGRVVLMGKYSEFPSVDGRLDARRCWSTAVGAAGQATRADSLGGSVPAVSG